MPISLPAKDYNGNAPKFQFNKGGEVYLTLKVSDEGVKILGQCATCDHLMLYSVGQEGHSVVGLNKPMLNCDAKSEKEDSDKYGFFERIQCPVSGCKDFKERI